MSGPDATFATALNCIDGRVQLSVNEAVRSIFSVDYVDTVTEAGIVRFLSDEIHAPQTKTALSLIQFSLEAHGSTSIAVAAHHDCAGNPRGELEQKDQLRRAVEFLRRHFAHCSIVGLWVDAHGSVEVAVSDSSLEPDRA